LTGRGGARQGKELGRSGDCGDAAGPFKRVVTGVEMFKKLLDEGQAATTSGCCCGGRRRKRGARHGAGQAGVDHAAHEDQGLGVHFDEGRRGTATRRSFNGYRPQFYFRTTDVTGVGTLPEGTEMVMPGINVNLAIELITPIAMELGLRFAIREGGPYRGRPAPSTEILG